MANSRELASPEPTVPLSVFQQLQARLDQLEISNEYSRWPGSSERDESEVIKPKRRKNFPEINHDLQCRTWKRWFSAQQGHNQDVRAFIEWLDTVVKELHDPPGDAEFYYKMRTGIKSSIREILDVQIIQPTNCEDLISLALRIEKNEKTAKQDPSPYQSSPVVPSCPQDRRSSQPRPPPRHQGSGPNEVLRKEIKSSPRGINGAQPRINDAPRGPRRDREGLGDPEKGDHGSRRNSEQPTNRGTRSGQKPPVDRAERERRRENNLCFDCGEADHRPNKCNSVASKPVDDGWDSKPTDGWENKPTDGWDGKATNGWDNKPTDGWSSIPKDGWTAWDPTPPPIERFQSHKKEEAQSPGGGGGREAPRSPQQTALNQSKWSPNGNVEVASLLD